jgi:hypothetical protein
MRSSTQLMGFWSLMAVSLALTAGLVAGCNSSDSSAPTSGSAQANATYVGNTTCYDCHNKVNTEYAGSAHGQDFHTAHGQDLILGRGGACAACHVTGAGEASGYKPDGSTRHLEGIGCESCHGPGSLHSQTAAFTHANDSRHPANGTNCARCHGEDSEQTLHTPGKTTITRLPDAVKTCFNCHVSGSYKSLNTPTALVTDATASLKETAPGKVGLKHPQAHFLLGKLGYNTPDMPSPHTGVPNTCVTCHLKAERSPVTGKMAHSAASLKADVDFTQPSCATCHSGSSRSGLLATGVKASLIELGGADPLDPSLPDKAAAGGRLAAYATAHNINLTANTAPDDPAVKKYKAARYNYAYILVDASYGAHNPRFTHKLINDIKDLLAE